MLLTHQEKNEYAENNYRLVYFVCQKFKHSSLTMDELQGYGQLGLTKALNSYDKDKNIRFSTFATK